VIADLKPYAEYKESGLPWLGQVPDHWSTRALKRLCSRSALYGANIPASAYLSAGVRFLRTTDITDDGTLRRGGVFVAQTSAHDYMLADGDILVSRSGTIGRSMRYRAEVHGPCAYAGYLVRFVPAPIASADYLFHFTKSLAFADFIRVSAVSSTIENVNGEKYANMPVTLPPPDEQAAIVRFLDWANGRLERAIRAKRKVIVLLNEQKQAVIHRAVTRGLDPSVPLKPSGIPWLGDIPQHWEVRRLKALSPRISGRLVYQPAQYFTEDGVPFLMGNNVTPDGISWANVKRIPESVNARFAHHALREGDVITVRVGAPGTTCEVPREADGLNCGSLMITRRSPRFHSRWLARTMNSSLIRHQIAVVQYGAAQEQININDAMNFLVPVPSREEQENIASKIEIDIAPIAAAKDRLERAVGLIREYRTRLVADVVTGKLDVREAAALLPEEAAPDTAEDAADLGDETEPSDEEAAA
jgi:type I restriction enzyme S subunit